MSTPPNSSPDEWAFELIEADEDAAFAVRDALTDQPQPPSKIGRKAKVSAGQARRLLDALEHLRFADAEGNGAWTRYRRVGR